MIAQAITEDRTYQSMGVELDRIWMGAMSWGLVRPENPQGNGAGGGDRAPFRLIPERDHKPYERFIRCCPWRRE